MTEEEGTDKHDEPDEVATQIATALSQPTHCYDCSVPVWAVPGTPTPRCLDCARTAVGINWASGEVIGEWHPSPPSAAPPPTTGTTYVHQEPHTVDLMCFWCSKTWPAPQPPTPRRITTALNDHEQHTGCGT